MVKNGLVNGDQVIEQEILLKGYGRIRDLKMGPDGALSASEWLHYTLCVSLHRQNIRNLNYIGRKLTDLGTVERAVEEYNRLEGCALRSVSEPD